jgi:hypothetical protein
VTWTGALRPIRHVVAVVGCQRSGTTLIGQLVGAHPAALLVDETDGLYPWFCNDAHHERDAADVLWRARAKYRDADSRVRRIDGAVHLADGVDTLILKAPNLTYDEAALAALPVPTTVVYTVRDPRAVVASMARLSEIDFVANQLRLLDQRGPLAIRYREERQVMIDDEQPSWIRRAVTWKVKSGRLLDFRHAGLPAHLVRYEDLVRDPDAVLFPVFAGSDLNDPVDTSRACMVYQGFGPGGTDRTRAVDRRSLTTWSDALDPEQAHAVLNAASPLASRLGYV